MTLDALLQEATSLSTRDLDNLISLLAEKRAHMEPPVPFSPPKPGEDAPNVTIQGDPYLQARRLKNGGCAALVWAGWHSI